MKSLLGYLFAACIILLIAQPTIAAGPKSIFDDDWVPPRSEATPKPALPKIAPAPVEPKPADPVVAPKDPVPVAIPVQTVRRPIPAKAEQVTVRKTLREVYAEQLADTTTAGRQKLTEALLTQADRSKDAPVDQFVLLAAAIDAGIEAVNLPLALIASDRMATAFEVDPLAIKADTAGKLVARPGVKELTAANAQAALDLSDQLAEAEDFPAAAKVCQAMLPTLGSNAAMRAEVQKRQRDIAASRDASEKVAKHVATLKATPDDPQANAEVGKYLCFYRADWPAGLPALARGNDPKLKALATSELDGPKGADAQVALGDAWWDLSQQMPIGRLKAIVAFHATDWYEKALPEAKGLARAKLEKRIAQAQASSASVAKPAGGVEILWNMNGAREHLRDGVVVLKGMERINTTQEFKPPVAFKIIGQTDSTNFRMSYAANFIIFNHEGDETQLYIHGGPADNRHKRGAGFIPKNKWVTIDLVVKPDAMIISVDGEQRYEYLADFSKIKDPLAIFPALSTIKIKSVKVKEGG